MGKHMLICVAFAVLLSAAACSMDDVSQEENNDEGNVPKTEENVQPVFAKKEAEPLVIQEPVSHGDFRSETIPPSANVTYELDLKLDEDGTFQLDASISVENLSEDAWEHLVFYVIPNAFTEENKPDDVDGASKVEIQTVQINDKKTLYSLDGDTLAIELEEPLKNGKEVEANIAYMFTVPDGGFRFTTSDDDYFLAHFYPMLATYQDGWNKEDYNATGESYHTDFSDFTVSYDIPEGYTVFSSADNETDEETETGELAMANIKEFFMAIMETDKLEVQKEDYDGTELRLITDKNNINAGNYMEVALESLQFFDEKIGPYPHDQLDVIILDQSGGMEYPGIVTVMDSLQGYAEIIAHEIAHQWFYGVVSNDAFHDPLVDEGMTQFATYLFLVDSAWGAYDEVVERMREYMEFEDFDDKVIPANLSLAAYEDEEGWTYSLSVYSQTAYEMLKLFQDHGKVDGAVAFLHNYFETYQYEKIDSEELINYLIRYLGIDDVSDFGEWLDVDAVSAE